MGTDLWTYIIYINNDIVGQESFNVTNILIYMYYHQYIWVRLENLIATANISWPSLNRDHYNTF